MAERQPDTIDEPPNSTTSLFAAASSDEQRGFLGASDFLSSPVQTTFSRILEERDGDIAVSTAHRRNSSISPTPSPTTSAAGTLSHLGQGGSSELLRRRSRSHSGDRGRSGAQEPSSAIPTLPLGGQRARHGWGGHTSPIEGPLGSSGRVPVGAATGAGTLSDIRAGVTLDSPHSRQAISPSTTSAPPPRHFYDPFESSTLSLASTTTRDVAYTSSESDEEDQITRRPQDQGASSPLRSAQDWSSNSSNARRAQSTRSARPSTSASPARRYPQGSALGRRSTLHAVGLGIRRASMRVVSPAGVDEPDFDQEHPHQKLSGGDEEELNDEKTAETVEGDRRAAREAWAKETTTLRGKSLGIFGPESPFRKGCAALLVWTYLEPLILFLIIIATVVFAIESAPNVYVHPRPSGYFHKWEDYVLLTIYSIFTAEIGARIVAHGLWFSSKPQTSAAASTQPPSILVRSPSAASLVTQTPSIRLGLAPSLAATGVAVMPASPLTRLHHTTPFALALRRQRKTHQQALAFLRHSFNRMDLIAVLSFWIAFGLRVGGGPDSAVRVFQALSVLRCVRLLGITAGTNTILQSLKTAAPKLVDVGLFVAFAMVLFSIIGVQSFSGSFKRYCVWNDPAGVLASVQSSQHCGGFSLQNGTVVGYNYREEGMTAQAEAAKGFICEWPSTCAEVSNPSSFKNYDNIFTSFYLTVVLASVNTYTDVEYSMMDAESFAASLFFVIGVIILNLWLFNLVTAVVTSSFADIRQRSHHSAFAATASAPTFDSAARGSSRAIGGIAASLRRVVTSSAHRILLAALALASVVLLSLEDSQRIFDALLGLTLAFDVEICLRFCASLPDWRSFWSKPTNNVDLLLAIGSTVHVLPVVRDSEASPWLAAFAIMRFYRVVLAIPRMRRLLLRLAHIGGALFNIVIFVLGVTFLMALLAAQLFRGIPAATSEMSLYTTFNSFLGMFQILSSENWTDVVGNLSGQALMPLILTLLFLCAWLVFGYFIIMSSLFVAVINEAFTIAEEDKRRMQLEAYLHKDEKAAVGAVAWLSSRLNPYQRTTSTDSSLVARFLRLFRRKQGHEQIEMEERDRPSDARVHLAEEATHRRIQSRKDEKERRAKLSDFIAEHPTFDRSLFIFRPSNPIRRFCQLLVPTSDGSDRLDGSFANKRLRFAFSSLVLLTVVLSLVSAAMITPLYRLNAYLQDDRTLPKRWTWYNILDCAVGGIFVAEALVKIIADGFIFGPDAAYLPGNGVDLVVLVAYLVNVISILSDNSTRFTRALKAFRALRLINLFPRMRQTFHHVIVAGATDLFDASALAVLYLIPFAVWGQQLFSGLLFSCNDSSVTTMAECVGEFVATPVGSWGILQPRVWSNPEWSFDSFRASLLILFEIVSLEGWIDVLASVMNIRGPDLQPSQNSSPENAVFLVVFQLLGAAFILTLFVSLLLSGIARRSGASLLTIEQRRWIDLRKLISRQRHIRAPKTRPGSTFRAWCFDRAVDKTGWWSRLYGAPIYCVHLILLATSGAGGDTGDIVRNYSFLVLTLFYLVDLIVRFIGLGISFLRSGWNLFDLLTVVGVASTTLPVLLTQQYEVLPNLGIVVAYELQKLFLVTLGFKLVQKVDKLNTLFKVAAASLPSLLNMLGLWLIAFGFFAIAYLEVFGLTRWGSQATSNKNYSTPLRALLLLALASTGEGWNQFMHDYMRLEFPRCTESDLWLLSDCGSGPWALALFASWNIISMYLFTSLILTTVIDAFSAFTQSTKSEHTITREQWRSFKHAWHEVDIRRTGTIPSRDIGKLFGRLDGIFEVRIYPAQWSVSALKQTSGVDSTLDIQQLSRAVAEIDETLISRRRKAFDLIFNEAAMIAEEEGGQLSFTAALLLIAQHKLVDDEKALLLEDLVDRRHRLARVEDRIRIKKVLGRLDTLILRRRFLKSRAVQPAPVVRSRRPTLSPINTSSPDRRRSIIVEQTSPTSISPARSESPIISAKHD